MDKSIVYRDGINRIYSQELESQRKFIDTIIPGCRGMDSAIIYKAEGFFVPNNEYMTHFFDASIMLSEFGCYDSDGNCRWLSNVAFPIYNVVDDIVGLAGFNPFNYLKAKETDDWSLTYYSYPTKEVLEKGKYLYFIEGVYKRALDEGYLIITDGLFDMLSVAGAGFLSSSLLGSTLTQEIIVQLRFIDKVILISDNDKAGIDLYRDLNKVIPKLVWVKQGYTKDSDDLLKSNNREKFITELNCIIKSDYKPIVSVDFSKPLSSFK